ncbi:MAG: PqqD family protein [Clostridia bacterium]|nr:PqqD family protein [Clostridia bacterium]
MKRNENFVLKELMGSFVLVPVGEAAMNLNGVITLNETAKFLWDAAEGEFEVNDLIDAVIAEYEVDIQTATEGVEIFLKRMKEEGCIE